MSRQSGRKKSGFTLPEVLVTVAIVSVLAAIVVPTVTSQIGKGDDTQITTTITNLRTGITAFVSDTRRFPGRVSDLYNPILATDDILKSDDDAATDYGAAVAARWRGPYVSGALPAGANLPMGLASMMDALTDSSLVTADGTGQVIAYLAPADFGSLAAANRIDALIDAGNGDVAGIFRWTPAACAPCTQVTLQLMGSR